MLKGGKLDIRPLGTNFALYKAPSKKFDYSLKQGCLFQSLNCDNGISRYLVSILTLFIGSVFFGVESSSKYSIKSIVYGKPPSLYEIQLYELLAYLNTCDVAHDSKCI